MHEVLDGDATAADAWELRKHLAECESCRERYQGLETSEALVRSMSGFTAGFTAPGGMTDRIMGNLPIKKSSSWFNWLKRHPAISVAAVFMVLMMGSLFSTWNGDKELVVKVANMEEVIIKGNTVIIPPGQTVNGNLVVEGGQLQVSDNVNVTGNITIIDGSLHMASTAHIAGQIKTVDEMFGWLWYKVTDFIESMR